MGKRLWLIIKMAFKSASLVFGMCIYAFWMVDLYNIAVVDENRFVAILKSVFAIPIVDLAKNYAQDMFFQGEHAASMVFACIVMSIPLLPLIFTVLFRGLTASFGYLSDNLMITYVYKDSGKYAYSEVDSGSVLLLAFSILIRIMLVGAIVNIAPVLILISLPINFLQLIWIKRRK